MNIPSSFSLDSTHVFTNTNHHINTSAECFALLHYGWFRHGQSHMYYNALSSYKTTNYILGFQSNASLSSCPKHWSFEVRYKWPIVFPWLDNCHTHTRSGWGTKFMASIHYQALSPFVTRYEKNDHFDNLLILQDGHLKSEEWSNMKL